jgi:hypothetical protein
MDKKKIIHIRSIYFRIILNLIILNQIDRLNQILTPYLYPYFNSQKLAATSKYPEKKNTHQPNNLHYKIFTKHPAPNLKLKQEKTKNNSTQRRLKQVTRISKM